MQNKQKWDELAGDAAINKAAVALREHGIDARIAEDEEDAKKQVLEIIPKGSEVMNMTSMTLDTLSLSSEINESGNYDSVRKKLNSMNQNSQKKDMNRLGAAPEYAIGSVHAVTEDGHVLIASATGSQLPAYAYGAEKVLWVVGAQKIVKNTEEGIKRIYEHSFPLENERAKKVYGVGSGVNKILIVNKEVAKGRMVIIITKKNLGF